MTAGRGAGGDRPEWVRDAVFYQIFVDRFAASARVVKPGPLEPWAAPPTADGFKGGDLLGIAERLDYLADLGITALYLTPVFKSASNHRYHTVDYEAVDPLLGGDAALRELLDKAHERGIRVILDGVFNHSGRGFWPFDHVLETGAASPYRDWFHLSPDVKAGKRGLIAYPTHSQQEAIARHRRDGRPGSASMAVLGYDAWWDLPALPKLNHSNPAVREFVYGIAERWLRFGIDGWRLDVPAEIHEPGFWEEFRRRVLAVNPEAYLVGELWDESPEWLAGDRFHAAMNYPLAMAILSYCAAGTLDGPLVAATYSYSQHVHPIEGPEFGRWLEAVMASYAPATTQLQLNLLDSHDTPRFLSLAGGDRSALRLAALIQMTLPGAPCVYYGDEIGLEGGADPDCRRAFPWDPSGQDAGLRRFMRGLIALRKSEPAFRRGAFRVLSSDGPAVAFGLEMDGRALVVVANTKPAPARLRVPLRVALGNVSGLTGVRVEQVSWEGSDWPVSIAPATVQEESLDVGLPARGGVILRVTPVL